MRVLVVVQRYGREVFGGAESLARDLAEHLVAEGTEVEVLTSTALSYVDWANHYPAGDVVESGVGLHRLPVQRPRDGEVFDDLNQRVLGRRRWVAAHLQREWMRLQGPLVEGLEDWIVSNSRRFDVALCVTYLYHTTWTALRTLPVPSILQPTVHDESPAYLPLFDEMFRLPRGFAFLTEEEEALVDHRYRIHRPSRITGIGIELDRRGDTEEFRRRFHLGDVPYITAVGRADLHKGAGELLDFFHAYKSRRKTPLKLVFIGENVARLPPRHDVVYTGFVSEETKAAGIAGAELLVQPSYFESFSIVLCEAWAAGIPALVQGRCDVLVGQARRSGGGIPYTGYAEFETGLEMLLEDPGLRRRLAAAGRGYVERMYSWPHVLARYQELFDRVVV